MPRDTILFDINETVLDLSSLKSMFKAAFRRSHPFGCTGFIAASAASRYTDLEHRDGWFLLVSGRRV